MAALEVAGRGSRIVGAIVVTAATNEPGTCFPCLCFDLPLRVQMADWGIAGNTCRHLDNREDLYVAHSHDMCRRRRG
jgi:hypothetical protein